MGGVPDCAGDLGDHFCFARNEVVVIAKITQTEACATILPLITSVIDPESYCCWSRRPVGRRIVSGTGAPGV
jgi:hypothetical protein